MTLRQTAAAIRQLKPLRHRVLRPVGLPPHPSVEVPIEVLGEHLRPGIPGASPSSVTDWLENQQNLVTVLAGRAILSAEAWNRVRESA